MKARLFDILCSKTTLLNAWKSIKQKGASGGIDGVGLSQFESNLNRNISELAEELRSKKWTPKPYLRISISKKDNEKRNLGLLSIKDKIVQQAIKTLIEPRFDKSFVPNSFGYRPNKGHTKAIKFARCCCQSKKTPYLLRLDIDNYFDNINHEILFKRIKPLVADEDVLELVRLCVKMGVVDNSKHWIDVQAGVPQGAILSPMLSNHYLTPFDQFVLSRTSQYVRYADDFIICCESQEQAESYLAECSAFLTERLKLQLNEPSIVQIKDGVEFLGVMIDNKHVYLSPEKKEKLASRIRAIKWTGNEFDVGGKDGIQSISRYYVPLISQNEIKELDTILVSHLCDVISEHVGEISNKSILTAALGKIDFLSQDNILNKNVVVEELIKHYSICKSNSAKRIESKSSDRVSKAIRQRKNEYRKIENESTDMVVSTPGSYIGIAKGSFTLKVYGKKKTPKMSSNLEHLSIVGDGVSISSNVIRYCLDHKIGIDYFSSNGQHSGSLVTSRMIHTSLWQKQSRMSESQCSVLASAFIRGKLNNQLNLIKYFHKYHKSRMSSLCEVYEQVIPKLKKCIDDVKSYAGVEEYREKVMGLEAYGAELYWSYVRELISDDNVSFERRERKGAEDLFNCMLNYGYALLYPRVLRALLTRRLNPMCGVLHLEQAGKPTLAYDVIELFRAQAVDRVVISLVQKGEHLSCKDGKLTDGTKKLLTKNVFERLNRYEKYRGVEMRLSDIVEAQVKEIAEHIDKGTCFRSYVAKW